MSNAMNITVDRMRIEWHEGSHTANVYDATGWNADVFTFAWEKDKPSRDDFMAAARRWLAGE